MRFRVTPHKVYVFREYTSDDAARFAMMARWAGIWMETPDCNLSLVPKD